MCGDLNSGAVRKVSSGASAASGFPFRRGDDLWVLIASPFSALEQVDDLRNQSSEAAELIGQCWLQSRRIVSELADDVDDHTQIRKRLGELIESHV
jgi:hypothetical protein